MVSVANTEDIIIISIHPRPLYVHGFSVGNWNMMEQNMTYSKIKDIKSSSASSQSSPHSLHQAYSPLSVSLKPHSPVPPTCHHQLIAPGQDTLSPYWTAFTTSRSFVQYVNAHCSNSMWTNTPSMPYLAVPSTHHTVDFYGSGIAPMLGYPQNLSPGEPGAFTDCTQHTTVLLCPVQLMLSATTASITDINSQLPDQWSG